MKKHVVLGDVSWQKRSDHAFHFTINKGWTCVLFTGSDAGARVYRTNALTVRSSGVYVFTLVYLLVCLCTYDDRKTDSDIQGTTEEPGLSVHPVFNDINCLGFLRSKKKKKQLRFRHQTQTTPAKLS